MTQFYNIYRRLSMRSPIVVIRAAGSSEKQNMAQFTEDISLRPGRIINRTRHIDRSGSLLSLRRHFKTIFFFYAAIQARPVFVILPLFKMQRFHCREDGSFLIKTLK